MNTSIDTVLTRLQSTIQMQTDAMKMQNTALKDGKPNPIYVEQEGREKIDKSIKPYQAQIDKYSKKVEGLKSLDTKIKDFSAALAPLSSSITSKAISSPGGIGGTAPASAALETRHITIEKKASYCIWKISPRNEYQYTSWSSEDDVAVSSIADTPNVFDISGDVGGPHLRISDGNGTDVDVTLTNGMKVNEVANAIEDSIAGSPLAGKIETNIIGPDGKKEIALRAISVGDNEKYTISSLITNLDQNITMRPDTSSVRKVSLKNPYGASWNSTAVLPQVTKFGTDPNDFYFPNPDSGPIRVNGVLLNPAFEFDPSTDNIDTILALVAEMFNGRTQDTGVKATVISSGDFRHLEFESIDGKGIHIENVDHLKPFAPEHAFEYSRVDIDCGSKIISNGFELNSPDNLYHTPGGANMDISGVIMPANGDAFATTFSVVPKANWYGLVDGLSKAYSDAQAFVDAVENEVDSDGVHTSPLYASNEVMKLRNLLTKFKSHSCSINGEKITWANLGVTFSGSKMSVDKTTLENMQTSSSDAGKLSAFLNGMANNEGRVRPAGGDGAIQAQVSRAKIGGRLEVNAFNAFTGQIFAIKVQYNGGDRILDGSYDVEIFLHDDTEITPALGTFSVAVIDHGSHKSLDLTGAVGGQLDGLKLKYICPSDDNYDGGSEENIAVTYSPPGATANIKTKVEILSASVDPSKMSQVSDIVYRNAAVPDRAGVVYNGILHPFNNVTVNPDGTATLRMTNGDLAGLSLKVSATGGNLVDNQTYVFPGIKLGAGIGNLITRIENTEDVISSKMLTAEKNKASRESIMNNKKQRMEEALAKKVHAARMHAVLMEMQQAATKAAIKMLTRSNSQD